MDDESQSAGVSGRGLRGWARRGAWSVECGGTRGWADGKDGRHKASRSRIGRHARRFAIGGWQLVFAGALTPAPLPSDGRGEKHGGRRNPGRRSFLALPWARLRFATARQAGMWHPFRVFRRGAGGGRAIGNGKWQMADGKFRRGEVSVSGEGAGSVRTGERKGGAGGPARRGRQRS